TVARPTSEAARFADPEAGERTCARPHAACDRPDPRHCTRPKRSPPQLGTLLDRRAQAGPPNAISGDRSRRFETEMLPCDGSREKRESVVNNLSFQDWTPPFPPVGGVLLPGKVRYSAQR